MKKADNQILINAIKASIENHQWCNQHEERKRDFLYRFKYMVWYLLLLLASPHNDDDPDKMVCAMTPVNEKCLKEYAGGCKIIRLARLNDSFCKIRKNYSVLTPYSIWQRCHILKDAISFYLHYKNLIRGYLHFTLEYYSIARYILEQKISRIIFPCMYDRYSTFLSYIAREYHIVSIGVQDGAAIDIHVPHKVYCTRMYCFDEHEEKIIRHFISNSDCEYVHIGFKSMINWCDFDKKGKFTIGVASQDWHTSKTMELLDDLLCNCDTCHCTIIVFPHYRENETQYEPLKMKYPELVVKTGDRYRNIDLLVTFYSTIVYDYLAENSALNVKCLKIDGYCPGYYERNNVTVYSDIKSLVNSVFE